MGIRKYYLPACIFFTLGIKSLISTMETGNCWDFELFSECISIDMYDFCKITARTEKKVLKDWTGKYIIVHTIGIYMLKSLFIHVMTLFDIDRIYNRSVRMLYFTCW